MIFRRRCLDSLAIKRRWIPTTLSTLDSTVSELRAYLEAKEKALEETKDSLATLAFHLIVVEDALQKEKDPWTKEREALIKNLTAMKRRVNDVIDKSLKTVLKVFKDVDDQVELMCQGT